MSKTQAKHTRGRRQPVWPLIMALPILTASAKQPGHSCTCLAPSDAPNPKVLLSQAVVIDLAARVSSRFSLSRLHPLLGVYLPHFGDDIAAPEKSPVLATGNGVIERVGRNAIFGNYLVLRFGRTCIATYMHLATFAAGIVSGTSVRTGQILAGVGSTGRSSASHLHYQLAWNNTPIDPHCQCGAVPTPSLIAHSVTQKRRSRPRHPRTHHVFQQPKEGL